MRFDAAAVVWLPEKDGCPRFQLMEVAKYAATIADDATIYVRIYSSGKTLDAIVRQLRLTYATGRDGGT